MSILFAGKFFTETFLLESAPGVPAPAALITNPTAILYVTNPDDGSESTLPATVSRISDGIAVVTGSIPSGTSFGTGVNVELSVEVDGNLVTGNHNAGTVSHTAQNVADLISTTVGGTYDDTDLRAEVAETLRNGDTLTFTNTGTGGTDTVTINR